MNTPHRPMRHAGPAAPRDTGHQVIHETIDRLGTEPYDQSTLEPAC